jgi:hypothetical protein
VPRQDEVDPAARGIEEDVGVVREEHDRSRGGAQGRVEIGGADEQVVHAGEGDARAVAPDLGRPVVQEPDPGPLDEPAQPLRVTAVMIVVAEDGPGSARRPQASERRVMARELFDPTRRQVAAEEDRVRLEGEQAVEHPGQRRGRDERAGVDVGDQEQAKAVELRGKAREDDLRFGHRETAGELPAVGQVDGGYVGVDVAGEPVAHASLETPQCAASRPEERTSPLVSGRGAAQDAANRLVARGTVSFHRIF